MNKILTLLNFYFSNTINNKLMIVNGKYSFKYLKYEIVFGIKDTYI